jgi:hypothetical protein
MKYQEKNTCHMRRGFLPWSRQENIGKVQKLIKEELEAKLWLKEVQSLAGHQIDLLIETT